MRKQKLIPLGCLLMTTALPGATTLIGGSINNGDFEATADGGTDDGDRTFSETANWTNVPPTTSVDPGAAQATRTGPAGLSSGYVGASGGYNAVVSEGGDRIYGNDPGYTIQLGDVFDASYYWIDAYRWGDADDQINVSLYVTDDNSLSGTQTVIASALSGLSTTNATYQMADHPGIYAADGSHAGKSLFVRFSHESGAVSAANGFARLDDFTLQVTSVPEPGSAILCVFGSLAFLRRKRG